MLGVKLLGVKSPVTTAPSPLAGADAVRLDPVLRELQLDLKLTRKILLAGFFLVGRRHLPGGCHARGNLLESRRVFSGPLISWLSTQTSTTAQTV